MRHPELTARQRLAVASVVGEAARCSTGTARDVPAEQVVAELLAISRDPVVLGHALGAYLGRLEEDPRFARAVEALRAAGADEGAAAAKAAWLREKREKRGGLLP